MFSYYMELVTKSGLVGMAAGSGPSIVAPFGGTQARFCTNPIAFGFPSDGIPVIWGHFVELGGDLAGMVAGPEVAADMRSRPTDEIVHVRAAGGDARDVDGSIEAAEFGGLPAIHDDRRRGPVARIAAHLAGERRTDRRRVDDLLHARCRTLRTGPVESAVFVALGGFGPEHFERIAVLVHAALYRHGDARGGHVEALVLSAIVGLVIFGVPVALSIIGVTAIGMLLVVGDAFLLATFGTLVYSTASNYAFVVVPMFVLMGEIAGATRIITDLYTASYRWLSGLRSGVYGATVLASAGFAALSGSKVVNAAVFTRIALPENERLGYSRAFGAGCIAASGALAAMIPPSLAMVLYGLLTGE